MAEDAPMEVDWVSLAHPSRLQEGLLYIRSRGVDPILRYLETGEEQRTRRDFALAYGGVMSLHDTIAGPEVHSPVFQSYVDTMREAAGRWQQRLLNKLASGGDVLQELSVVWQKHTILVFCARKVYAYLDASESQNTSRLTLVAEGVVAFHKEVFEPLQSKVVTALLVAMKQEREGLSINRRVLQGAVQVLTTLDDVQATIVKPAKDAILDDLEWVGGALEPVVFRDQVVPTLVDDAESYYKAKFDAWWGELVCEEVLIKVDEALASEEERVRAYLHVCVSQPLLRRLLKLLVEDAVDRFLDAETGFKHFLTEKKLDSLKRTHRLFSRADDIHNKATPALARPVLDGRPCCTKMARPLRDHVSEVMGQVWGERATSDDAKPAELIAEVLVVRESLEQLVVTAFDNEMAFQKARNEGVERILNVNMRCGKYLAIYCDHQLSAALKDKDEREVTEFAEGVCRLFMHLQDKDVFLNHHQELLAKRLVEKTCVAIDGEKQLIALIKGRFSTSAVSKMESMVKDLDASADMMRSFREQKGGLGVVAGVEMDVKVLAAAHWPFRDETAGVQLPRQLLACVTAFDDFYKASQARKRLEVMWHLGSAELHTRVYAKEGKAPPVHMLVMSCYQAILLLQFNEKETWTFMDLLEATRLPREEAQRHLMSVTLDSKAQKHKLLNSTTGKGFEPTTELSLNKSFELKRAKMQISMIKRKTAATDNTEPDLPHDRESVLDAHIVRIMKARKSSTHQDLVTECVNHVRMFSPQPKFIKERIDALIQREFLRRDEDQRHMYHYLA